MSGSQLNARKNLRRCKNQRRILIPGSILAVLGSARVGRATNDLTWIGNVSTSWNTSAQNWVFTGGSTATQWLSGTGDIARFTSTTHSPSVNGSSVKGDIISFENSAASYTISNGTWNCSSGGNITLQSTADTLSTSVTENVNFASIIFAGTAYGFANDGSNPNSSLNFGGATVIAATNASTQTTLTLSGTGTGLNTISTILSNGTGFKLGITINASAPNNVTNWKFSNANTYTGITGIFGGSLIVANTTGSATGTGTVSLGGGTLASGTVGSVSGAVTANTNPAKIAPGGVGSIGTLNLNGGANFNGSTALTTINFDLGTGPAGIITTGDLLNINGTANVPSGTALTFGGTPVIGDDYRLIGGTAVSGITPTNFALPSAPSGESFSLSNSVDSGFIDLVVGVASSGPASLTWNNTGGTGDGIHWDTTSQNWNNGTGVATYSDTSNTTTGDNVTFNDTNNGSYAVTISGLVHPTSTIFNTNNASGYVITGANASSGISGTGLLTLSGTGLVTISSNNNYSGGTYVNAGTLKLASGTAFPVNTALNVSSGAQVIVANHASSAAFVPQISVLNNSGTIDITNNALVIHNASIGTVTTEVAQAYNGGLWTGTNASSGVITSSTATTDTSHLTAIGVANGLTSFETLGVSVNDVLVKYTYYGDADLSGTVDGSDYSRIDNAYLNNQNSSNTALTGWFNGDFNYDGVINGSDYTLIDNAFNSQGATIASAIATPTAEIAGNTSAVPEPTAIGLLGIGAMSLLSRRRQRRETTNW